MQKLIQLLEVTLQEAQLVKQDHAQQIEALTASWQHKLEQDNATLIATYEDQLKRLRSANDEALAEAKEELADVRRETEEARGLWSSVEAKRAGVLPTESLPARMLFDKLAERWEALSLADVEMIEAVLDGKVLSV